MKMCPNETVMFTANMSSRLTCQAQLDMVHISTHLTHDSPRNRACQHSGFQMMSPRGTQSDLLKLGKDPK